MKKLLTLLLVLPMSAQPKKPTSFQQNWSGEEYNQKAATQFEAGLAALNLLAFNGDERVLDVGCGSGKTTVEIAKRVPNGSVLGVDLATDMIAFAQKTYTGDAYPNVRFMEQNVQNLTFNEQFDIATSFFCLHWVPDLQAAFKGIAQSLVPGGTFLCLMIFDDTQPDFKVIRELIASDRWKEYFVDFKEPWYIRSEEEIRKMLEDLGMRLERCEAIDRRRRYTTRQEFIDHIATIPIAQHLPSEKRDEFFNDFADRYCRYVPPAQDGTMERNLPVILVIARKQPN